MCVIWKDLVLFSVRHSALSHYTLDEERLWSIFTEDSSECLTGAWWRSWQRLNAQLNISCSPGNLLARPVLVCAPGRKRENCTSLFRFGVCALTFDKYLNPTITSGSVFVLSANATANSADIFWSSRWLFKPLALATNSRSGGHPLSGLSE